MFLPVMEYISPVVVEHTSPIGSASPIAVVVPPLPSVTEAGAVGVACHAVQLSGDQIDRTRRGRPEAGAERVVAHRVMLSVVPEGRDRVAVVVTEVDACREENALRQPGTHRRGWQAVSGGASRTLSRDGYRSISPLCMACCSGV